MGLIKEPKDVDFSMKSQPWTEKELEDFRIVMRKIKSKRNNKISPSKKKVKSKS